MWCIVTWGSYNQYFNNVTVWNVSWWTYRVCTSPLVWNTTFKLDVYVSASKLYHFHFPPVVLPAVSGGCFQWRSSESSSTLSAQNQTHSWKLAGEYGGTFSRKGQIFPRGGGRDQKQSLKRLNVRLRLMINQQNKWWQCTFLQTTHMLELYFMLQIYFVTTLCLWFG